VHGQTRHRRRAPGVGNGTGREGEYQAAYFWDGRRRRGRAIEVGARPRRKGSGRSAGGLMVRRGVGVVVDEGAVRGVDPDLEEDVGVGFFGAAAVGDGHREQAQGGPEDEHPAQPRAPTGRARSGNATRHLAPPVADDEIGPTRR
jgi:hypothetical protein